MDIKTLHSLTQSLNGSDAKMRVPDLGRGYFSFPISEVYGEVNSPLPLEFDFYNLDSDRHLSMVPLSPTPSHPLMQTLTPFQWWPTDEALYEAVLSDLGWWTLEPLPSRPADLAIFLSLGTLQPLSHRSFQCQPLLRLHSPFPNSYILIRNTFQLIFPPPNPKARCGGPVCIHQRDSRRVGRPLVSPPPPPIPPPRTER